MYAIIESGGKQYKVAENDIVRIDRVDSEIGSTVTFDNVLMLANGEEIQVGSPYIQNSKVFGEITNHERGEKIKIIKFRRRKHFLKRAGHRQNYTMVKITEISK